MSQTIHDHSATTPDPLPIGNVEREVIDRYARGAQRPERALCCPTDGYDPQYLKLLPDEVIEKDYGCGDPSRYVREGETVVDLGSGTGKICYILAQKVTASGRVIGLDFNDAMLDLARKYVDDMAEKLGYRNVAFHKAKIQDMAVDLDVMNRWLREHPIRTIEDLGDYESECQRLREHDPLIPSDSVDVVVSNCVLNLVRTEDKTRLFHEMYRILKPGGRVVISDIICDENPTPEILADPKLWSGCISGAFREDRFLEAFSEVGFYGIEILSQRDQPWQVIDGVEFRAMTIRAYKGSEKPCLEGNQAVIYKGPWKQVHDDDGHIFHRGKRIAVCDKTYKIMSDPQGPYRKDLIPVAPNDPIPHSDMQPFDCKGSTIRHPRQTKGNSQLPTRLNEPETGCSTDSCC